MEKRKRFVCQANKENGACMIGVNGGGLRGRMSRGSPEDEPLTLIRCGSCGFPRLYEALEGWKSVCLAKPTT